MRTARINETIGFSVNDEAKIPMDAYPDAKKNSPMKDPQVPPVSILPTGFPRRKTEMKKISEGIKIIIISTMEAKNFPSTSW